MKRYGLGAIAFLTLAGVIGLLAQACVGGGAGGAPAPMNAGAAAPDRGLKGAMHQTGTTSQGQAIAAPVPAQRSFNDVSGTGAGATQPGGPTVLPMTGLQRGEIVGAKIVKTAQLSIVTRRGRFDDAYRRATE